jgi:hypothetical protein
VFITDSSIHAIQSHPLPVTLFVDFPSPLKLLRLEQDFHASLEFRVTAQDPNKKPDSNSGVSYTHQASEYLDMDSERPSLMLQGNSHSYYLQSRLL